MPPLAIDFGTSNTLVAEWDLATGAPRTVKLAPYSLPPGRETPALIPSILYVKDAAAGAIKLGAEVLDAGLDLSCDKRFFSGFKRAIVSASPAFAPRLDGLDMTASRAGGFFLEGLLKALREKGHAPDELVFTAPIQAFETYGAWLGEIAKRAGIQRARLLDESTAAALGYEAHSPGAAVLVVDFGGGTLDLSLVRLGSGALAGMPLPPPSGSPPGEGTARVIAKTGEALGGEDIDHWLVDDFLERHSLDPDAVSDDAGQLKALAERVKIALSQNPASDFVYFSADTLKTYSTSYTRAMLEDLLEAHDFYRKLQSALESVLKEAELKGLSAAAIERVLLVGGTTLIPSVKRAIRQNFGKDKVCAHKPFEAVAHGALRFARGIVLQDFLHHGYGLRYWNARTRRHAYEPLLAPGESYPTHEPLELVLRASRQEQPAIELVVGEMAPGAKGASEVIYDGRRWISRTLRQESEQVMPLNAKEGQKFLIPLEPPGKAGSDRLRVHFRVDGERRLRITVWDLETDKRLLDDVPVVDLR